MARASPKCCLLWRKSKLQYDHTSRIESIDRRRCVVVVGGGRRSSSKYSSPTKKQLPAVSCCISFDVDCVHDVFRCRALLFVTLLLLPRQLPSRKTLFCQRNFCDEWWREKNRSATDGNDDDKVGTELKTASSLVAKKKNATTAGGEALDGRNTCFVEQRMTNVLFGGW